MNSILIAELLFPSFVLSQRQQLSCRDVTYPGFDLRLKPTPIARIYPASGEHLRGFEIVNGRPVVAFENRIVAFSKDSEYTIPISEAVQRIAGTDDAGLLIQTANGIYSLGDFALVRTNEFSGMKDHISLYNSGNHLNLIVRAHADDSQFFLSAKNGRLSHLFTTKGKLEAVSWNQLGLAVVVDDVLMIWRIKDKGLTPILKDKALAAVRDVCLIGQEKAVVTLRNSVLLVTSKSALPLVAMSARCTWTKNTLSLLDENSGTIWAVEGVYTLGGPELDHAYAKSLLRSLPKTEKSKGSAQFFLAACILGCSEAIRIWNLASRSNGTDGQYANH